MLGSKAIVLSCFKKEWMLTPELSVVKILGVFSLYNDCFAYSVGGVYFKSPFTGLVLALSESSVCEKLFCISGLSPITRLASYSELVFTLGDRPEFTTGRF